MKITLNDAEKEALLRPANGEGGFQGLLRGLQAKLDQSTGEITLTSEDREKLRRYAFDYGQGTFEDRIKDMFGRHLGADLAL